MRSTDWKSPLKLQVLFKTFRLTERKLLHTCILCSLIHTFEAKSSLVIPSDCQFNTGVCFFLIMISPSNFCLRHQERMKSKRVDPLFKGNPSQVIFGSRAASVIPGVCSNSQSCEADWSRGQPNRLHMYSSPPQHATRVVTLTEEN